MNSALPLRPVAAETAAVHAPQLPASQGSGGSSAAEISVAVPLMAEALRRKGGKVFTNCAVRGLEMTGGRISSVVTEKGSIACDTVVLAGGA